MVVAEIFAYFLEMGVLGAILFSLIVFSIITAILYPLNALGKISQYDMYTASAILTFLVSLMICFYGILMNSELITLFGFSSAFMSGIIEAIIVNSEPAKPARINFYFLKKEREITSHRRVCITLQPLTSSHQADWLVLTQLLPF